MRKNPPYLSLLLATAGIGFIVVPALAYDATVTSTQTTIVPQTVQRTVTSQVTTTPVVTPDPDATVTRRVETDSSDGLGDSRKVVREQTTSGVAPVTPTNVITKKTQVEESNSLGDRRKVETTRTLNSDGYMVQENYHEKQNY